MLNKDKVILMTKLSIYEQKEGRKEIPISRYFKDDYVSLHMIYTFFAATVAYILCVGLWVAYKSGYFIENLTNINLFTIGKNIFIIYIVFIIVNLIISYIVFTYKFKKIRQNLKEYNGKLKQLKKIQERERFGEEQGGDYNDDDSVRA